MVIGTAASEIFQLSKMTGNAILITEGHFTHELCGLAPHPTNPDILATCGDDHTVRIWSCSRRCMVSSSNNKNFVCVFHLLLLV